MREYITDEHIGKLAYKRRGFFGGLIGKIAKSEYGVHNVNYVIEFAGGSRVGIVTTDDIEYVSEEESE